MVNFATALRNFATPEWKVQYLDYLDLRDIVEHIHDEKNLGKAHVNSLVEQFKAHVKQNIEKINAFVKKMEAKYLNRQRELNQQLDVWVRKIDLISSRKRQEDRKRRIS